MNEFHRINKNEKQKSWLLRNFLLTINFYLMFLLFDGKFFLYVIGFFGFFTVILLLKKIIQSTSFRRELNSKDLTKIIYKFLKINKLFIVAAILGLIFSTIILAQIVLVSGSYDQQIFTEMVADSQDNYILTYEGHIDLQFAELNSMIGDLEHSAINLLNSHNFEYLESFVNFRHSIPVVLNSMDDEYTESTSINLYEWNDNFFQFLYQFPSFDKSLVFNESLNLAIFDPDCDLDTDYIYNNGLGVIPNNDMTQNISFSIPVDRIWKTTQQDDIYFNENELWNNPFGIYIGENMYITNRTHLEHILNEYSEVIDSRGGYNDGSSSFRLFIIAEIPDLHTINLDEYKKRLRRLVLDAERDLYQQDVQEGNYLGVYSPLLSNIMNYEFYVVGLKLTMLLVSGPLLIISMYLVYFSLSLVESRKSRLVAIMKIRGISTEQATITMISEVIFGSILALITGLIMSIPWTILSLKSSGLLEFDASPIPLVIPTDFYWKLPFMSMILAFNLNIASIRALSKTSVDSAEVFIEKRPPFWQRYYLDLIGFGTSLVYLIYIRIIPVEVNEIFDIVLQVIGIYMLFIFILFAPLVVSRYFSNAIGIASDYIWNKEGGIIALSTKNMGKNRFSSSKLVTLMMFGLMCSTIGIVIPDTFMSYTEEKQYYDIGADMVLNGINQSDPHLSQFIEETEGIVSYSMVVRGVINPWQYSNDISDTETIILGIDPDSFVETAFWNDDYAESSLETIVESVKGDRTIAMQSDIIRLNNIDDYLILSNGYSYRISLSVEESFKYFPNLVTMIPHEFEDDNYYYGSVGILTSIDTAGSLFQMYSNVDGESDFTITESVYLKLEEGVNATMVKEELISKFNSSLYQPWITSVDEQVSQSLDDPFSKMILASMQNLLIITVLICIIAITYFSFITISERKREIGVYRALGLISNQIFQMLLLESLILLFSAVFMGLFAGLFSSHMLFYILNNIGFSYQIPPFKLIINWALMFGFIGILIIFSIVGSGLPSKRLANRQTGSILRGD